MKMIKNRLFITLFIFGFVNNVQAMESEESFSLGNLPIIEKYNVAKLMSIVSVFESLKEACQTINALALTNKEWNALLNDPKFCLKIIKNLAKQFVCSDEEVIVNLRIQEAKRRLEIQDQFYELCDEEYFNEQEFNSLYNTYKGYVDLDFIYYIFDGDTFIEATLLIIAAEKGNCSIMRTLLDYGADVNQGNNREVTPLMLAAYEGQVEAVKCLLENRGIVINKRMLIGLTALSHAVIGKKNSCLIIKILLNYGADINGADDDGITPLMSAVSNGKEDIVKCLLSCRDIAVNKQARGIGLTALIMAIDQKSISIVQLLLDAGANPNITTYKGLTPLQAAQRIGDQEIIALIMDAIRERALQGSAQ